MNKILISLIVLCTALMPCKAQGLVGPGEKPVDPTTQVAEIVGGNKYTTLPAAFAAITSEAQTVKLLYSPTLKAPATLAVNYSTTFNLGGYTLNSLSSDLTVTIATDKTLTLMMGTLSGSLVWNGAGRLFAGTSVDLSGLTLTKDGKMLYRVLLKLPVGYGTVKDAYFGQSNFTTFAQSGDILCCWLPQYAATQNITFNDDNAKRYLVANVLVAQHTVTTLDAVENPEPDLDIAEVTFTGETIQTKYKTLMLAFKGLTSKNGAVKLRSKASLADPLPFTSTISFDLNNYQLTASNGAAFKATSSGNLHVKNGELSGLLRVEGDVVIDKSVVMAGASVLNSSGTSVYRVRLVLPVDATGKTHTYSYNGQTDVSIPRNFAESSETVAYLWLAANSIGKTFTLTVTDGNTSTIFNKNDITINANHDNMIDLKTVDDEAELDVGGTKTTHTTFHDALAAAKTENKSCTIILLSNVGLSVGTSHELTTDQIVTIDLNGHNLTGGECWLGATADRSAYIITDSKNTGSLTGKLQIKGCVHIKDIAANKIGQVVDKETQDILLYRLMVTIAGSSETSFVTYTWDGTSIHAPAYAIDGKVCLFQTSGNAQRALNITANSKVYSASGIIIAASHSNVTTVRLPEEVAKIGSTTYSTLTDALTAAGNETNPVTIELLNHATLNSKQSISKKITIDLKEFTLTMEGSGSEWEVVSGGSLYIKSSSKAATILGNFKVSDNVCISADVAISGSVTKGTYQVYRTRLFLPATTTVAVYTFISQGGNLIFPGEKRDNGQEIGYAFLQVESGYADLTAKIANPSLSPNSYTLKQVFLQAFHNNQFDMQAGDDVVEVNGTKYSLFSAALTIANQSGGTIKLLRNLTLAGIQSVTGNVTINLVGNTLNTTDDAYFNIDATKTLTIEDSEVTKGFLYGIYRLQGSLFVAPEVKIAGTVVREGEELYRCLTTGIDNFTGTTTYDSRTVAIQKGTACFWLPPVTVEHDLAFQAGSKIYEVTLQPALPNHNNRVQAYPVVKVDATTTTTTWVNADYNGYNVYLAAGARLEIEDKSGITNLHRVVMGKGAEIVCNTSVLATAGITYCHQFIKAKTWEAFSLPYHARLVRMTSNTGIKEVRPYQMDGTGGDFWLKTIAPEGRFDYVTEERIMANIGYIIAVPSELTSQTDNTVRIDFVSPTEQFLNRKAAVIPEPKAGEFMQTASGMLCKMKLERPFYKLNDDGTEYTRVDATTTIPSEILPFTSFLLSDTKTLATYSSLRMGNLPTAVDTPLLPDLTVRVTGVTGGVCIASERETTLQVYTLMGRLICLKRIAEGTTFLPLQPGLYIVNREKVVVR